MNSPSFDSDRIYEAYMDCRRRKRGTLNALRFEMNQAENLANLEEELNSGSYCPARSVCFVNLKPKPREIFAADFRDRVVHHLFIRTIEKGWEKVFIHDSYACRPGKGTHAAVDRLERYVKSITHGGRRRAWFLQIDIHNFFMSIDRRILFGMIEQGLRKQYGVPKNKLPMFCPELDFYNAMRDLAETLIFHDASDHFFRKSPPGMWKHIADHKTLFNCPEHLGLPIGNLTSQFFGNVYLNALDQFLKHKLKVKHYIRYVDDAVLLHEDKSVLKDWKTAIEDFIGKELGLRLNKNATRLKPVSCGINFLGYIVHPTHRLTRRRVIGNFEERLTEYREMLVHHDRKATTTVYQFDPKILERLLAVLNSYLAHMAKANSHNLLTGILDEHSWLFQYFMIVDYKAMRIWKPPKDFSRLANQYGWFRQTWPEAAIFFQVGRYYELYGKDAMWANVNMGLKTLKPRFRKLQRVGIPARFVARYMEKVTATGQPILRVSETGYPLWRLKERFPEMFLLGQQASNPNVATG